MTDDVSSRYRLLEVLGEGSTTVVWRAYDTLLDREIAVKELRPGSGAELAEATPRFLEEARAAAHLRHPNILSVHDVVSDGGRVFIAMELIAGPTLLEVIRSGGPQPTETVRAVMAQVARALAGAHAAGVAHGDLSADSVFWTAEGRAVVADFRAGPPGRGPADDVVAWAALAYQLATGRLPPNEHSPEVDLPDDLLFAQLVAKCLAQDSGGRPADGAELVRELTAGVGEDPPLPHSGPTQTTHEARETRGRSARRAVVAIVVLVALTGVIVAVVSKGPTGPRTDVASTSESVGPPPSGPPIRKPVPSGTGALDAGPYVASRFQPRTAFDVPRGWDVLPPEESGQHLILARGIPEPSHLWVFLLRVRLVGEYRSNYQLLPLEGDIGEWLRMHPLLSVRQLPAATIGGRPAIALDVEATSPYTTPKCAIPCVVLFDVAGVSVHLLEGDRMRVYVVTVGGEQIVMLVQAPSAQFDAMLPTAESVIRTITFP